MKFLRLAQFNSDLPDDLVEEDGEIAIYPGQGVARAIGQMIRDAGYRVTEPEHQGLRGWDFFVETGDQRPWMLVSDLGAFFILQSEYPSLARFLPKNQRFRADVLRIATRALQSDPRFHDFLWFEDIHEPFGFTDPVVDAPGSQRRRAPAAWC